MAATEAVAHRAGGLAPRRLLSGKSQASGDWHEALPWMQYHWLPDAVQQELEALAYVRPTAPTTPPDYWEFLLQAHRSIALDVPHTLQLARQWLVQQN